LVSIAVVFAGFAYNDLGRGISTTQGLGGSNGVLVSALGSSMLPPGVDPSKLTKVLPVVTAILSSCGGNNTLIDVFSLATSEQGFITSAVSIFTSIDEKEVSDNQEISQNPYVRGVLDLLTSENMTDLIKNPTFEKVSNSLNLTCIVTYPAVATLINESASGMLETARSRESSYSSLDVLSEVIQAGLLLDMGTHIMPSYMSCGGDVKLLVQFIQALAFWMKGNIEPDPLAEGSYPRAEETNLKKYRNWDAKDLNKEFKCKENYKF